MENQPVIPMNPIILKPGVFSSYGNGWRQFWKYFLELLVIGIITFLLTEVIVLIFEAIFFPSLLSFPQHFDEMSSGLFRFFILFEIIFMAYSILFVSPLEYGVMFAYLKAARGEKLEVRDMFEGFRNYWNAVLSYLLVTAITIVGLVLLIIPGIIFALKLSFVPYLVTDRKLGVIDAVKESWRMTGGHTWQIFFIGLMAIPVMLLGFLALILGIIPALMWIYLAMASLYHAVSLENKAQSQMVP